MNVTQIQMRGKKIEARSLELRNQLWPELDESRIWVRQSKVGFTTIPRALPLIHLIMDNLSNGKPVSSIYFSLWSRVYDQGIVTISNPREMAFEPGFSGQRAENTWSSRMKILKKLNFIDNKPGPSGDFSYILIWNPYLVIKDLYHKKKIPEAQYNALFHRAQEVGADDLL